MASKSAYQAQEKGAEIEEALDVFEKLLERLRGLYEQYFMGIAKVAPSQLHTEAERRQRDLTQIQIKNTALRYRYATLSQKFGAYNTYWKRTMRMIEQGRYVRDLQRVQRQAAKSGEEIPEEILAAMPKMMRERVRRDRAAQQKIAARQGKLPVGTQDATIDEAMDLTDEDLLEDDEVAAPPPPTRLAPGHVHRLDDALVPDDVDLDEMFATLTRDAEAALDAQPAMVRSQPPRRDTIQPPIRPAPAPAPDFDPPTEPNAPPAMDDGARRRGPTTPPLRPPPMRSSLPSIPPPRAAAPPPVEPPTPAPAPARPGIGSPPSGVQRGAGARPGVSDRSALGPPPGMSESETRTLYNRYLKARELCGESNDGVTYDKLLRTLRSQSSRIMTDHRARGVEFGVVIKDNKVVLKAKPKV